MRKNIYLCLLLTTLVIQQGFKTKTQLQKLAEGIIELKPTKNNNDKKEKSKTKKSINKKWQKKPTFKQHSKLKLESK